MTGRGVTCHVGSQFYRHGACIMSGRGETCHAGSQFYRHGVWIMSGRGVTCHVGSQFHRLEDSCVVKCMVEILTRQSLPFFLP